MKARLLPPRENYSGNLVWNKKEFEDQNVKIEASLLKLRGIGYWASPFPEGDGIAFNIHDRSIIKSSEELLADFQACFDWVLIEQAKSLDSNSELSDLEYDDSVVNCIIVIPLKKIYIQKTVELGGVHFLLPKRV